MSKTKQTAESNCVHAIENTGGLSNTETGSFKERNELRQREITRDSFPLQDREFVQGEICESGHSETIMRHLLLGESEQLDQMNLNELDDFLDSPELEEVIHIRIPQTKHKAPVTAIFNTQYCEKHLRSFTKKCYSCYTLKPNRPKQTNMTNKEHRTKLNKLVKKLKDNQICTQQEAFALRGRAEENRLRKQVANHLLEQPNTPFYWVVDGKPMSDIPTIVKTTMYGYRAEFRKGLPGGMIREKEDVDDRIPHPMNKQEKKNKTQKSKTRNILSEGLNSFRKQVNQENIQAKLSVTRQDGSKYKGFKGDECLKPVEEVSKLDRANENFHYMGKTPMFQFDPFFLLKPESNDIEDAIQLHKRANHLKQDPCILWDPLTAKCGIPIFHKENLGIAHIVCHPLPGDLSVCYYPLIEDYYKDGSCAYYWKGRLTLYVKVSETVHEIDFGGLQLRPNQNSFHRLVQNEVTPGDTIKPTGLKMVKTGENIKFHPHVIEKARSLISHKTLNTFTSSEFIKTMMDWFNKSVHALATEKMENKHAISLYSWIMRDTIKNRKEVLPIDKKGLAEQKEIIGAYADPPEWDPERSLLLNVLKMVLPTPLYEYVKQKSMHSIEWKFAPKIKEKFLEMKDALPFLCLDAIDTLDDVLEGIKGIFRKIKQTVVGGFETLVGLVYGTMMGDWTPYLMQAYPQLKMEISVVIEELIKTIPFGGLWVSFVETHNDIKYGKFSYLKMIQRIVFHNAHELIPFGFIGKLITLPFRIAFHYGFNKLMEIKGEKRVDFQEMYPDIHREPNLNKYVNGETGELRLVKMIVPRYTTTEQIECKVVMPVDLVNAAQYVDHQSTETQRGTYAMNMAAVKTFFPAKNAKNFMEFAKKRQYQGTKFKDITQSTKELYIEMAEPLRDTMEFQPVTFEQWANKSPKKQLYFSARAMLQGSYSNVKYGWKMLLKFNELGQKNVGRTFFATDPTYTVAVGPMMCTVQESMKQGLFSGKVDWGEILGCDVRIYVLYASVGSPEIEEFYTRAYQDQKAFYLAVVGDDTGLTRTWKVLCMDMSRFDSTQVKWFHWLFTKLLPVKIFPEEFEVYKKQQDSPIHYVLNEDNNTKVTMPKPFGLYTGCMETSISNTWIMALTIVCGLRWAAKNGYLAKWTEWVPEFASERAGFIPKSNVSTMYEGFEFCKKGWILSSATGSIRVSCVPLLSNFHKLGKAEKDPRLIVPLGRFMSDQQVSIDFDYLMLRSMFEKKSSPWMEDLFNQYERVITNKWLLEKYSKPMGPDEVYKINQKGASRVHDEEMFEYWMNRYKISVEDIMEIKKQLTNWDRPRLYLCAPLEKVVDIDYGRD